MGEKYEPVRAEDFYIRLSEGEEARITNKEKSQLEKLEEKVNSLELTLSYIVGILNRKVDSIHIIDAINNSPEVVRIKGSAIKIDIDTLIQHGVIKS
ncbi:hypothetical protein [Lederbergia lenta]|uniref:hypothetical protein n=1 Tax=Lederbergia lenta TaxID=1467 RepID=UPI00203C1D0A|nr:hypothetical protein [Lederbergia lenta]MCM3111688.1 hypothetical protein [Lederbergia lenta]